MKKIAVFAILVLLALTLTGNSAKAQSASVFAGGLKTPIKLIITPGGNLLVAESGTGQTDGRISLIDASGNRRTLVDGLPSGISLSGGEPAPSGPTAVVLRGHTLYVLIGLGDATIPGPAQGSLIPNPQRSSELFSSVLALRFDSPIDDSMGNFAFTQDDYDRLSNGGRLKTRNSAGQLVVVDVLANFRDYTDNPRPDVTNNVRDSNPFGMDIRGSSLYIADASQNAVFRVDIDTRDVVVETTFASKPNPLPFGPPFMEPVPTSARVFGKQLLVSYLTGFPFAAGQAEVRKVNLINNSQTTLIGGLSSATDVLAVKGPQGQDQFYTLEFSTDMLANAPGRLQFFSSSSAAPVVVASGLISPIGMARDEQTNSLYIASIFTGTILKVQGVQ